MDADGFGLNLLSEVVGLLAGVGVAVLLVDWIVRRRRDRQFVWAMRHTERAIATVIQEITAYFRLELGPRDTIERRFDPEAHGASSDAYSEASGLALLCEVVRLDAPFLARGRGRDAASRSSRSLYTSVEPLFARLWFQFAPRVSILIEDVNLLEALDQLENREIAWRGQILRAEQGLDSPEHPWEFAAEVISALSTIYQVVLQRERWRGEHD